MAELLWWHRVGQKVTLVDQGRWVTHSWRFGFNFFRKCKTPPKFGTIYTIAAVGRAPTREVGLSFVEMPIGRYYNAAHFLPIRETSIDCFRSLLTPTPDQVRELEKEHV